MLRERCSALLASPGDWNILVDSADPNIVRFFYPIAVPQQSTYVAPQVLLELGTHAEFVPRANFVVRAFAAAEFPKVFDEPDVAVTALLAKRTFWEKVTILHAEFHRPASKAIPGRYSRHYHDVAMMATSPVKAEALADFELLAQVVRHKEAFYPAAWAQYARAVPGQVCVVPQRERWSALKEDYRKMSVMIFGEPPTFENLLDRLHALELEINSPGPKS